MKQRGLLSEVLIGEYEALSYSNLECDVMQSTVSVV